MNGMHDLGGMTCFGPVRRETDEPVFHADWERRIFGTNLAVLAFFGPVDRARHAIERMDPIEYLTTSYYEHWLAGTELLARELGYVTASELESGISEMRKDTPHPAPDAAMIEGLVRGGVPASRQDGRPSPRFAPG